MLAMGAELRREFKLINQLRVTRGQMEPPARILQHKGAWAGTAAAGDPPTGCASLEVTQ